MGARYYFGAIGRFLAPDPALLNPLSPLGLNRFVYGNANPIRYTDPLGRQAKENCDEVCQIKQQYEKDFGRESELAKAAETIADGASTTGDVIEVAYETVVLPGVKIGVVGRAAKWLKKLLKPTKKGVPKVSPKFKPPTNSPQAPPTEVPSGWRVREMPPTAQYPNGYWKLEKPMNDGSWQPIDPSTMRPGGRPQTHIPFPPNGG